MPISLATVMGKVVMGGRSQNYVDTVKRLFGSSLIDYLPMAETSGTTAFDQSTQANNGTYTGVTLNNALGFDNKPVPLFVPANNSRLSVYSAAFNADFNGQEGLLLLWFKPRDISVWTDGTLRRLAYFSVDPNNFLEIYKHSQNNKLFWQYMAGGISKAATVDNINPTGWTELMLPWSKTADTVKFLLNGVQQGNTLTGLGSWSGNLNVNNAIFGATHAGSAGSVWDGWLAHAAIGNVALG